MSKTSLVLTSYSALLKKARETLLESRSKIEAGKVWRDTTRLGLCESILGSVGSKYRETRRFS